MRMSELIKTLCEILPPSSLILLLVVIWQFKVMHQRDKKIFERDEKVFGLFDSLSKHTEAIQRFLGVLEGRRIS